MNPAPAQISFVSNLLTSKIFLAQIVTMIASIASAAGVHILDDQGMQQQAILLLDAVATALLRWLFPTGPVSLTGPVSTPANQNVPVGASVVHVAAPAEVVQTTTVQPLTVGEHTVSVAPPAPMNVTPASVTVKAA